MFFGIFGRSGRGFRLGFDFMGKVGSKRQVTIPKAMREALGSKRRSEVTFMLDDDKIVIKRFSDA